MTEMYTTGEWFAKDGEEREFVEAWRAFASWAHGMPGAGTLRLTRDLTTTSRFVSFGRWEDTDSAHRWKADPEFRNRMAQVQQHVASFNAAELELVAAVGETADA